MQLAQRVTPRLTRQHDVRTMAYRSPRPARRATVGDRYRQRLPGMRLRAPRAPSRRSRRPALLLAGAARASSDHPSLRFSIVGIRPPTTWRSSAASSWCARAITDVAITDADRWPTGRGQIERAFDVMPPLRMMTRAGSLTCRGPSSRRDFQVDAGDAMAQWRHARSGCDARPALASEHTHRGHARGTAAQAASSRRASLAIRGIAARGIDLLASGDSGESGTLQQPQCLVIQGQLT